MHRGQSLLILLCVSFGIVWCSCPYQWFPFRTSCYLFGNTTKTFAEAEVFCKQYQSHLVTVESKAENVFLKHMLEHLKGFVDYWMDLTDAKTEGVWVWNNTNINATFLDWFPGAPDSFYGTENCATFASYASYRWSDVNCTYKYKPICEKNMTASNPVVG